MAALPVLRLEEEEAQTLTALAEDWQSQWHSDLLESTRQVADYAGMFPPRLVNAVERFARHSTSAGGILVKGLPVSDVPPTPVGRLKISPTADVPTAHFVLAGVTFLLGDILGYRQLDSGHLFQHVFPLRGRETKQSNAGSLTMLDFHTELAQLQDPPITVNLLCLRQDPGKEAQTLLVPFRDVWSAVERKLSPREQEALWQPRFEITPDLEWDAEDTTVHIAALCGTPTDPAFRCDTDLMKGTDDVASSALVKLNEAVRNSAVGVLLERGDLLLIDNRRAAHGRSAFTPFFDGKDRWLLRTYAAKPVSQVRQIVISDGFLHSPPYIRNQTVNGDEVIA